MNKREAKFQSMFNNWLKHKFLPKQKWGAFSFELKHTHGALSIPFDAVKEHQINALLAATGNGIIHKISDETRGFKPFDCFAIKNCPAYVVIRYPDCFVLIDVETFIVEKDRSKRRSLTEDRAKKLSTLYVDL